jgi:chemotaxis protein methyltransferase CheR
MVAIKNRYGLDFTNYEKSSLKRGISRLMLKHNMSTLIELWGKILKDEAFFLTAIDDLLVNLTELFRNPDVWFMVRDKILDQYRSTPLKIWHAGCSTGEEVYTMAIVLEDKGMLHKTRAVATDLSTKALAKARKGAYSTVLLNQYLKPFISFYPNRDLSHYFDYQETDATIKAQYKSHVTYRKHNLVHEPMNEKFDIIFCRNVMIYFDEKLKIRVLDLINQSLNPGGYFVIGYYDIMPDYGKKLFDLFDVKTRIYRKKE